MLSYYFSAVNCWNWDSFKLCWFALASSHSNHSEEFLANSRQMGYPPCKFKWFVASLGKCETSVTHISNTFKAWLFLRTWYRILLGAWHFRAQNGGLSARTSLLTIPAQILLLLAHMFPVSQGFTGISLRCIVWSVKLISSSQLKISTMVVTSWNFCIRLMDWTF